MSHLGFKGFYYITHIDNLPSILRHGILSHKLVEERNISYTPIYDIEIVTDRKDILAPDGRSLWSFANLYLQPRNPMLYRVIHEKSYNDIVVVQVKPDLLNRPDIFITTGNARASLSDILPQKEALKRLRRIMKDVDVVWWKPEDGSKRKIMAECLVPDLVPPDFIQAVYVATHEVAERARRLLLFDKPVIPEPNMFFQPLWRGLLTPRLFLIRGDMFFSQMQTLTISVNCVGVMGKGLASRAKYQFPEVYVQYQDLCRRRTLKMGNPYLLRLEFLLSQQLADEPLSLNNVEEKWFLLFPTKNHWRERADINGIEQGLQWLQQNYKRLGIKSLATPALGCGLGRLSWRDVGPMLCKYLSTLDITVTIYLPREKETPAEQLTREFLLG
ncbi:MAG: DUF4433 domain-containing protein [Desulfobacterales bacterium]|nr:DUF4433 domain-containing protein [Desulfobacterales bacterium]